MDLDYRIVYSDRKTVSLSVERDGSLVVRAPHGTAEDKIRHAVEAKKLWLHDKTRHKQKYPRQPIHKEFVAGETILYLGRHYRLEIMDDDVQGIRFHWGFQISRVQQPVAGKLLRDWYAARAESKLPLRIKSFAGALGVAYGRILVSDLQVSWASCTPKNNLNFNWRIMKAPMFVVDYLIVHELAHLLEPNHTPRFWNIVAIQAPRYEAAKQWLRENGSILEEEF